MIIQIISVFLFASYPLDYSRGFCLLIIDIFFDYVRKQLLT